MGCHGCSQRKPENSDVHGADAKKSRQRQKAVLGGSGLPVLGGMQEGGGEVSGEISWKTSEPQFRVGEESQMILGVPSSLGATELVEKREGVGLVGRGGQCGKGTVVCVCVFLQG